MRDLGTDLVWATWIGDVLRGHDMFGRVDRKGKVSPRRSPFWLYSSGWELMIMCFTVRRTRPVIPFYRYTITSPPTILIKIERPSWGAVCARSEACRGEVGRRSIGDLWEVEGDVETGSGVHCICTSTTTTRWFAFRWSLWLG
jgi:hypothetical protein